MIVGIIRLERIRFLPFFVFCFFFWFCRKLKLNLNFEPFVGVIIPEFELLVTIVRCHHRRRRCGRLPGVVRGRRRHLHRLPVACCNGNKKRGKRGRRLTKSVQRD